MLGVAKMSPETCQGGTRDPLAKRLEEGKLRSGYLVRDRVEPGDRGVELAPLDVLGADGVLDLVLRRQGEGFVPPARVEMRDGRGEIVGRLGHGRGASATVDRGQEGAGGRALPARSYHELVRAAQGVDRPAGGARDVRGARTEDGTFRACARGHG